MEEVRIDYRRPPDRENVFTQRLILRSPEVIVTYLERTPLGRPVRVGGRTVLEAGSPAVWFTFPDRWHDIGRFHLADGTFTGLYANILTPVHFLSPAHWRTTDLFLDMWIDRDGRVEVLDREEFDEAAASGWIDSPTAARAETEVLTLLDRLERNAWPPPSVLEWTLERVQRRCIELEETQREAKLLDRERP